MGWTLVTHVSSPALQAPTAKPQNLKTLTSHGGLEHRSRGAERCSSGARGGLELCHVAHKLRDTWQSSHQDVTCLWRGRFLVLTRHQDFWGHITYRPAVERRAGVCASHQLLCLGGKTHLASLFAAHATQDLVRCLPKGCTTNSVS